MIAPILALALAGGPAQAKTHVSVGTGLRPFAVPFGDLFSGGGLRIGQNFGLVTPFVGGSFVKVGLDLEDDEGDEYGTGAATLWSGTAGAKVGLSKFEKAQPYVAAGALFFNISGEMESNDGDDSYSGKLDNSLGLFAGFGAEAQLAERVRLGVEVGVVRTDMFLEVEEEWNNDKDSYDLLDASAIWTYSNLHLTLVLGKGA